MPDTRYQIKAQTVYLGLGSNLGDKRKNIEKAIALLKKEVKVTKISSFFESKAVGYMAQPDFVNAVAEIKTSYPPKKLLNSIKKIEKALGRKRAIRWGPRLIDIDILFYDEIEMNSPRLTLPHPRLLERQFVLKPLAEIAPKIYQKVLSWKK